MATPRISVGARLLILLSGMAALATVLMLLIQDRTLAADLEQAASARLGKAARAASLLASGHVDSLTRRYRAISRTPQFRATLEVQDVPTLTHYAEQLASREGAALIAFLDASGDPMAIGGDPNLVAWTQSKPGLRADSTRAYALTRIALEASGNALGSLVAIEPITDPVLAGWSNLCGAQVLLRPPQFEPQAGVEQVVSSLGDLELRVAFSLDAEHDALVRSRTNLLMAGGVTLGLAFLASFFLSRSIVRPILEIQSATERIAQGDFDVHTPSDRMDEIGDVARAFDVMRDRLRGLLSELRQSRTQLENAQRLARIGSWQMDLQSGELTGSAEFRAMFGLENESETSKAIPHMLVLQQIHPEDRHDFEQAIRHCIEEGTGLSLEHRLVVQDVERIIHTQGRVISGGDGMAGRIEGTCQDVSERKRSEEQIRFLAYHDNLTGLGNRQFIVERLDLVNLAFARSALTGMTPDRVAASIASFDFLYLAALNKRRIVAPTVHSDDSRVFAAQAGGHVFEPVIGVHDLVWVFDFKSLYPSVMRTFNIDPLGFVAAADVAPADIRCVNDVGFRREPAILPGMLDTLFPRREAAKRNDDGVASQAIKILMNSFYGVLGTPACRFHNPEIANAITGQGRHFLQWSRDWFERRGYVVLYGDTDSVFVSSAMADSAAAQALGPVLALELTAELSEYVSGRWQVHSRLELEFEKLYQKLFLPSVRHGSGGARKRYAGVRVGDAAQKVEFVGMEVVRRDWTDLAKDVQRELYARLFAGEPVDRYLAEVVARVRAGALDAQLVYRKGLRKSLESYTANTPPHVAAARKLSQPAPRVIAYVMTTAGPEPLAEIVHEPDREHYVEKQVKPVAEPVLATLGLDFARVVGDDRQLGLF
ncbi:MAG: HAMP domain-containing protein [Myxococcales bacterium]|nr:HAMP domain-containing protein [Myxococcales bacterium]